MATFDTGTGQTGYAGDSTTLIKTGKKNEPGRILYKAGKGGSVSRTSKEQTPPSNELPAGQTSQYESGRPGVQVNPPKQTIKVEVNKEQVETLNREVDARELTTALIEGRVIKKGEETLVTPSKNQNQPYIPMTPEEQAKLTAPKQISPQETQPVKSNIQFDNPFPANPTYGGQINAGNKPQPTDTRSTPIKINQAFEEAQAKFMIASQEPGTLLPLIAVPARFAYGFANEAINIGKGVAEVGKQAIAGANIPILAGQVIEGTATAIQGQVERTSIDVWTGNVPGLAEESGRFTAQYELGKATDVIIAKPIKAGLKTVDTFIGSEWEGTPKIPEVPRTTPENPAFSRPWQDMGIKDITPRTPAKDFTLIPTEYTELAKTLEIEKTKVPEGSLDATQGETLPGTWLKESQPVDKQAELYYLEYGNKPPELQTILSKEQQKTNLPIRTTEEILAWQKETKATQLKLGEKVSKRPSFFDSERGQAWRERLKEAENIKSIEQAKARADAEIKLANDLDFLKRRAEYKKAQAEEAKMTGFEEPKTKAEGEGTSNPIYSSQPVMAIAQVIVEEAPKVNDWLKNKYALYKQSLTEGTTPIIAPPKELSIQNPPENFNIIMTINPGNTPSTIQQPSIITGNKATVSSKPAVEIKSYPPIQIQTQETTQIQSGGFLHQGSQRQSQEQIQSQVQVQAQQQGQNQIQEQAQAQVQLQQQTQVQKQGNIFKNPQRTPTEIITPHIFKNPQRTPTEIITPPFPKAKSPEQKRGSPFTVQVRKKGIFQTAGQTETLGRAVTLGETLVENTASASFKIMQEGKTVTNINPGREFTKSKKEAGVMIQQNKFRIGSPGEKTEITQKGILASKGRKKRRKGQWGF